MATVAAVKAAAESAPASVPGSRLAADGAVAAAVGAGRSRTSSRFCVDKIAHSPDFFRNAPLVLDVGALAGQEPLDLALLAEHLRQHRLMPVGIQNGSPEWNEAAMAAGLAVFGAGSAAAQRPRGARRQRGAGSRDPRAAAPRPARRGWSASRCAAASRSSPTAIWSSSPPVSAGAELAATGHIHVYGTLRGRAFAGIEGDEARHDLLRPARGRAPVDRRACTWWRGDRPASTSADVPASRSSTSGW